MSQGPFQVDLISHPNIAPAPGRFRPSEIPGEQAIGADFAKSMREQQAKQEEVMREQAMKNLAEQRKKFGFDAP